MTKKLKRPLAFLTAFAMALSVLLYVPVGTLGGFGVMVSAEDEWEWSSCPCETFGYVSNHDGTHNYCCDICGNAQVYNLNCNFVNGVCKDCSYACPHENGFTDGVCNSCGEKVIAMYQQFVGNSSYAPDYLNDEAEVSGKFLDRTTLQGQQGTLRFVYNYTSSSALHFDGDFTLDATGCTIAAPINNYQKLTVKGGTFNKQLFSTLDTADLTIENGVFDNQSSEVYCVNIDSGKAVISGGEFVQPVYIAGTNADVTITGGLFHEVPVHTGGSLVITGGMFKKDPSAVLTGDYCAKNNGDGTYSIQLHSWNDADKCTNCGKDRYDGKTVVSTIDEAAAVLREAYLERKTPVSITLSGELLAGVTEDNINSTAQDIYESSVAHIPCGETGSNSRLGDYISKCMGAYQSSASYAMTGSTITDLTLEYSFEYYTNAEQENLLNVQLESVYNSLNLSSKSDIEKIYTIYYYVVNNTSYDNENLNNSANVTKYTAYGAVYENKAVCQGFASLFYRMCMDNSIDCRIVTGTSKGVNHAWNIVKVGDKYYYADPTWDCIDEANSKPGTYFYFLRGSLADHDESITENVTGSYNNMAGANEFISAFKAVTDSSGNKTIVHVDGSELLPVENNWYDITSSGEACQTVLTLKGSSTIVEPAYLKGLLLYSYTPESSDHDFTSGGICQICDNLENGKDGYKSVSLTLTDGVIINYFMLLSDDARADENAYIHFTSAQGLDKRIMLSAGVYDSGRYKFSLELRPDQMADVITAQVVYGDGTLGKSFDYSVKQYAGNVTESDASHELVDAMVNFGAFTQLYTGENTDNLVSSVTDYTTNATIPETYNYKLNSNVSSISVTGATLQIGAYTTIRIKYQLADGANISDFVFKCGDTVLTPERSGDYYYVYLRNIRPQNLDEMYVFTVSDGTNTTTFEYSAYTYMKNVLDNAASCDKALVNLMNAMYDYNKAADSYIS